MKNPSRSSVLLCCYCLLTAINTSAQNVEWASLIHGQFNEGVSGLCTDNLSNVYITGRMSSGSIGDSLVNVNGTFDAYLAKYNSQGVVQWIKISGGSDIGDFNEQDIGGDLIYDSVSNAVYQSGSYQGAAEFGGNVEVFGQGAFLAKYDTDGTFLWVSTTNSGGSMSITSDDSGAIFLMGTSDTSSPTITFDSTPPVQIPSGPFIAKYNGSGGLVWAKPLGENVSGVLAEKNGRIYFGGWAYGQSSSFLGNVIDHTPNVNRAFLAALDTSFDSTEWLMTYRSSGHSIVHDMVLNGNNGAIIAGVFRDSLYIMNDTLLCEPSTIQPFVLASDSTGSGSWYFNTNASIASFVSTTEWRDSALYVGFHFNGSFDIPSSTVTANSAEDYAILKLGNNGVVQSLIQDGPVLPSAFSILRTDEGAVYAASGFTGEIIFDQNQQIVGNDDVFLVKYNPITSISSISTETNGQLLIYANPNTGTCTIDLPEELVNKNGLVLRVLDPQGRVVQETPLRMEQGTIQLDIRAQAKGTYVAEVGNSEVRYTGRIVFE